MRKEVSPYLQHYVPMVELSASPLLGSRDVIESLIGKAKQRLEANGRTELNKSILLMPCMCGELTQDLVAEALSTVGIQDVTTWVSENVGETMQAKRRREVPRSQPQSREQKPTNPLLIQDKDVLQPRSGPYWGSRRFQEPMHPKASGPRVLLLQIQHLFEKRQGQLVVGMGGGTRPLVFEAFKAVAFKGRNDRIHV